MCPLLAYLRKTPKPPYKFSQAWTKKAEQINCPAPLPEDPEIPLLTKMLVPAPYQAPENKAKGTRGGLRQKGTSDVASGDADTHSPPATDNEEEEESDSPPEGERKKRAASMHLEAKASKKGKISLSDDSESDTEAIPEWHPRPKPLAES